MDGGSARRDVLRIAAIGLLGTVVVGGCTRLPKSAIRQIDQANEAYRVGQYAEAERWATQAIAGHPSHPDVAEALYLRGLSRLRLGRRGEARSDCEDALALCKRRTLAGLLHVQLGHLDFQDGRYGRAAGRYRQALADLPRASRSDEFRYRYGQSLQRSGRFAEAIAVFRRVVAEHPSSRYAVMARRKVAWPHSYFAIQCGAYSDRSRAGAAADALRRRGIASVTVSRGDSASAPYLVHAGRYGAYSAATAALQSIRSIQRDAFVVP